MKLTFPITKERIRNHFAYAWWQYVLLICLAIFGWNLLYTTTRYRSPNDQRLEWYYGGYQLDGEKNIDSLMDDLHQSLFSDLEEVEFRTVMLDQTYGSMQLMVWVSAGEGDLFMLDSEYFSQLAQSEGFAREIMELFGIAHLSERHPHSLSEGQKRRVSIAAVAASQPELLLLDEPTVGQDREGLRTLLQALNLLHTRTGSTIVTVTHDRRCAGALCDRAAWLKDGRIEKTGGPELIEAAWGDSAVL